MNFFMIAPNVRDPESAKKRTIIERVAASFALTPHFAPDETYEGQDAEDDAINSIKTADFVIADLSYERPSCYYEVGIAHALGKPLGLLATVGTDIHQVPRREQVHFYEGIAQYEEVIAALLGSLSH